MRYRTVIALAIAVLVGVPAAAGSPPASKPGRQAAGMSEEQRNSYALGMAQARTVQKLAMPLDARMVSEGFADALGGRKTRLTDAEARELLANLQKQETEKQAADGRRQSSARKMLAAKNKAAGEAFLAAGKNKPGVVVRESGIQYRVLQAGFGAKPTLDDTVSVHYRGRLVDGKEFGSTYNNAQPISFSLKKVIPGWREVLPLMQVGSKWEVVIPWELADGEREHQREALER